MAFDAHGNPLEIAFFQADGKTPARQISGDERGASSSSRRYDAHGRLVSNVLSGCDVDRVGYAARKETREWFESGDVLYRSLTEFFDADGRACRTAEGTLKLEREVDRFYKVLRENTVK